MRLRNILLAIVASAALAASTMGMNGLPLHAPAPPRPIPPHGTGISTKLSTLTPAELDSLLSQMQDSGATWVRTDLSWNDVQNGGPSSYNWQAYDRIVEAANLHGIQTLFILDLTPAWARPANCTNSELCPPASPAQFSSFAAAAVERYLPRGVHSWEVWNEPNIAYRYHGGTNPAEYVRLLHSSYAVIKRLDPSADVVAASTAPSRSDSQNLSPADFLKAMYDNGAQGYFTAISTHPYTYPGTPSTAGPLDAWGQIATMHQIMADHDDGSKQIWLTEFGAPTGGPNRAGEFVSEDVQAQILSEAAGIMKQQSWFGPMFWYEFRDPSSNAATSENFYGLIRANGTPKPALEEFKKASKLL